ncbi:MAG: hypothetical protein GY801_01280, partial [bacterium]|nr:hypothetical protein [bacterium]
AITIADYQWNRPTSVLYPGGGRRELEYDGLMRLKHLSATDPGGNSLLDYSYSYDNSGNIVNKNTKHGEYSYGYDSASRLTSADNPTLDDESYSYDTVGNRTSASNADGTIAHNANNELTMYGELEYAYDANGNMTEVILSGQPVFTYHYNADNRLVKVEGGNNNTIAEYYYDPFGRRLWKDVAGTRTYFFYSDEGLIAEYDSSGTELTSYGYKPASTWSTDPLFLRTGGQYYFYHNDHLGTPQKLTAQNGMMVWAATYSAFGQAAVGVETVTNKLRFPGQYFDAETGLHYNFQRYYDPGIGRYVSVDPDGLRGGLNFFTYTFNNPLKYHDPQGLGVHPHQIVPPDEAYQLVENFALYYRLAQRDSYMHLLKKTTNFGFEMSHSIREQDYPYFYKALLLNWLGGYALEPGARKGIPGYHNRFLFSCQYGWLDMGHIFNAAAASYQGVPILVAKYASEVFQYIIGLATSGKSAHAQSAFTTEDFLSNELGAKWGRALAREHDRLGDDPVYRELVGSADVQGNQGSDFVLETLWVVQRWKQFLQESGAIMFTRKDDKNRMLSKDALDMWIKNDVPDDENKEDMYAIFKDEFRKPWDKVKCQFESFRTYCCCSSSVNDCEQKCQTGSCEPSADVQFFTGE